MRRFVWGVIFTTIIIIIIIIILLAITTHLRVLASSVLTFRDHTQGRTTVGRTPLYERSVHSRDLYLTNTQHSQQYVLPLPAFMWLQASSSLVLCCRSHFTSCLYSTQQWSPVPSLPPSSWPSPRRLGQVRHHCWTCRRRLLPRLKMGDAIPPLHITWCIIKYRYDCA
jgi:hypothetical protein